MDALILAATSFTISASLVISRRRNKLQEAFAGLCAAVFVVQAAIVLGELFKVDALRKAEYLGLLAIAPLTLHFFRLLTRKTSVLSGGAVAAFAFISTGGAVVVFTPLSTMPHLRAAIRLYMICALAMGYAALMWHVKTMPPGSEKKRWNYLLYACPIALLLCNIDLLSYWGFTPPAINGIVLSLLLYFILLIIAYPQLNELHDFLARALVILISTVIGAVIFYLVASYYNGSAPPLAGLLLASFLVVISLSPLRMIVRKIFSFFYPESKGVFRSLYEFDEQLEREKALMLEEMAPVFAHEIRNPLGSIKGAAQYLKDEATTDEQRELLNVIVEGTDRLNAVVSKFLDYARPYQLHRKRQSVNAVIRKAVSIIAANKLAEEINMIQDLDDRLPDMLLDEQMMMQVIMNMALNAIESMPHGGTLTFKTSEHQPDTGEGINIMIRDTGKGISKEDLNNIFKPFFTTKERGVGLGLAICQKIIKEHGGSMNVQSGSSGTLFTIHLKAV